MALAEIKLSELDGTNGFVIQGIDEFDFSGYSASGAGDVNGDGIDDLIIGTPYAGYDAAAYYSSDRRGESYVVFGSSSGFDASLNLVDLDGTNGFVVRGADEYDYSGRSVSSAGDINGDGIDDLIIGATGVDFSSSYSGEGESYVVFGSIGGFDASLNLADLDGTKGFAMQGVDNYDYSGRSVSSAGDINGDGIDDLIIGAPGSYSGEGESYVVFGSIDGFDASLNLVDLDGTDGFAIRGADENGYSGYSVSGAGDINGDGIGDLIIGAPFADFSGNYSGEGGSYVVFGSRSSFDASLSLADLDGTNGFTIPGIDESDLSGISVSGAGDINGDGIDDLIIGAPDVDFSGNYSGEGGSYVVFGSSGGFDASLNLVDLDGTNGFVIRGADELDNSGRSVSNAGDFNGDGIDDLIIGAPYVNSSDNYSSEGESYLIFGSNNGFASVLDLTELDGSDGFVITAIDFGDRSGSSVSGAGDINGDGADDLIITAPYADSESSSYVGESYVVFGIVPSTEIIGTSSSDVLTGSDDDDVISGMGGSDFIRGLAGNDRISGDGGPDLILAGKGNDTVTGNNGNDSIVAGNGNDSLDGGKQADLILGQAGNDTLRGGAGRDLLKGGNGRDFIVGGKGNDALKGGKGQDTLIGVAPFRAASGQGFGTGDLDTLTGGSASDTFVLGDETRVYYDDGNPLTAGESDFALITDFEAGQDVIQLNGSSELYQLDFFTSGAGTTDATLSLVRGDTFSGEAIATLQDVSAELSLSNPSFVFV
ncbi:MAG: hypothetical protein AAFY57_17220 [Cyanobacteria bacterium J06642_2]